MLELPEHSSDDAPDASAEPKDANEPQPGGPAPLPPLPPNADFAMVMLYEEQKRLRAQLDELNKKGEDKKEDGKEGGEKKEGEEGGKDDEKDKKEKKPPIKERVGAFVKEHPVGTLLSIIGFIVLLIAALLLFRYLNSYEDTDDAFIEGHVDPISARISGYVSTTYVENTYHVRKGQLLLELDRRDNQIAKEQAGASYAEAQAAVRAQSPNVPITATNEVTQVQSSEADVASASAQVAQAKAQYLAALADMHQAEANQANASREEERYRQLVVKEEVSREQYDQRATEERAQAAVVASRRETANAAAKAVTQAEAQLAQAQDREKQARENLPRQIEMQKNLVAQRKANELMTKAQADQAELNLEYTKVYAPEDGIVGDKQVQVGTQVTPGQELLALTQTNDIWVEANFKETQIRRMWPKQSVTLYVDALGKSFEGYVEALPGASGRRVSACCLQRTRPGNYVKVVQRLPVRIRFKPEPEGRGAAGAGDVGRAEGMDPVRRCTGCF